MTSHKPHPIQEIRVQEAGSKYMGQILRLNIEESDDRKISNIFMTFGHHNLHFQTRTTIKKILTTALAAKTQNLSPLIRHRNSILKLRPRLLIKR